MPRINTTTREQVREGLRLAARKVLNSRGFSGLTVRAVATEAGCSVGTLYTYFPDKGALVRELAVDSLGEFGRAVSEEMHGVLELGEVSLAAARAARRVYGTGQPAAPLLPVLLNPEGAGNEEFRRRVTGRLIVALGPVAAAHRHGGHARGAANAETVAIASFLFGLVLLESSGQLVRLEVPASEAVAAFVRSG